MHGFRELLDEFFEPVDFERGAHDDEQVGLAREVGGLDHADVVPERVRLVVEHDRGAQLADFESAGGTSYSGVSWMRLLARSLRGLVVDGYSHRDKHSGQSDALPSRKVVICSSVKENVAEQNVQRTRRISP